MIQSLTIQKIKDVYAKKGYAFFDINKPYNLNIGGIRSIPGRPNEFDDTFFVAYSDAKKKPQLLITSMTTEPGRYWLMNPMQVDGTAVMCEGQWRGCYALGLHHNEYKALRQIKPIKFFRDNDRDNLPEQQGKQIFEVIFANIHRANPAAVSQVIEKWSAACQVLNNPTVYDKFIDLCEEAEKLYGNSFTYTLLNENDFK